MKTIIFYITFILFNYKSFLFSKMNFLEKKIFQLGDKKIIVEIADKIFSRKKGLMFRKSLKKNEGMLFIFQKKNYVSFWMKNTSIPLDIAYFNENRCLIEIHKLYSYSLELVFSSKPVQYALEMNRGWFNKNKIKIGTCFFLLKNKKNK